MKWISVKVSGPPWLPEDVTTTEVQTFIVTNGDVVDTCDYMGGMYPEPWARWSLYEVIHPREITHYMPLPEPPIGE